MLFDKNLYANSGRFAEFSIRLLTFLFTHHASRPQIFTSPIPHRQNLPLSENFVRGLYKGCTRVCTRVEVQQIPDSIDLSWCQGSTGGRGGVRSRAATFSLSPHPPAIVLSCPP